MSRACRGCVSLAGDIEIGWPGPSGLRSPVFEALAGLLLSEAKVPARCLRLRLAKMCVIHRLLKAVDECFQLPYSVLILYACAIDLLLRLLFFLPPLLMYLGQLFLSILKGTTDLQGGLLLLSQLLIEVFELLGAPLPEVALGLTILRLSLGRWVIGGWPTTWPWASGYTDGR